VQLLKGKKVRGGRQRKGRDSTVGKKRKRKRNRKEDREGEKASTPNSHLWLRHCKYACS